MVILVPSSSYDELVPLVRQIDSNIRLAPYVEGQPVNDLGDVVGIFRGPAGKWFSNLVAQSPNLRWLHTASAGVDHVLTPEIRSRPGLVVTDSGPAFEIAISEFVMAWLLMVARGLPQLLDNQRAGVWKSVDQVEVYGSTVGILGLGPIGRGVASRARAFGMHTLGFRQRPDPVPSVDEVLVGDTGLARLLRESDYVVIAMALTHQTRALIGAPQFRQMKPTAWLVNIARGSVIDEPAMIDALKSGAIAGACLCHRPASCGTCATSMSRRTTRQVGATLCNSASARSSSTT
jgi:phosphoglycerate dehydrogenase-like enzyme